VQLEEERQMSGSVKINFPVELGDDGYPPVAVETLWANPAQGGYLIDSIPFFASEATNGDCVLARMGDDGALWFESVSQRSGNSLIRVVFFDPDCEDFVVSHLTELGCGTERMKQFKLLAVDIPPNVPLVEVQTYLKSQAAAGLVDYEEPILRQ
jgi:Domain of unknown function (DUF4265)